MAKQTGLFNEEMKIARGKEGSNTALHFSGRLFWLSREQNILLNYKIPGNAELWGCN